MKKTSVPEQQSAGSSVNETAQTADAYSRFNEPVHDKSGLANRVAVTDSSLLSRPIEEVRFTPPPVEKEVHPLGQQQNSNKQEPPKPQPSKGPEKKTLFHDPNIQDLPPAEKQQAAEQLANFILQGYQKLHDWGNKKVQISERKIMKLLREGKLDLRAQVPYELDQWITVGDFIKEFNEEYGQLFIIDPEWRAAILPPLIRILQKRGMGMSDEMYVGWMLAQDIGAKVFMAVEAFNKTSSVLQFAVEQTARMRGVVQMQQRPSNTPTEPPIGPAPIINMPSEPAPAQPAAGEKAASIPVYITTQVRQQLYDLGYTKADVDAMAPENAHDIINSLVTKPTGIPVQDHFMGQHGGGGQEHPMSEAVVKNQLPNWGAKADLLNQKDKRGRGRPPGSTNKKTAPKKSVKRKRA
jgi:hypothetical protein